MKNLVTTDWLEENLENVRLIDGSWHMPNSNRNGLREFLNCHIDICLLLLCISSVFFLKKFLEFIINILFLVCYTQ